MFKIGDIVQTVISDGKLYRVQCIMHYSELDDLPPQCQNEAFNRYGLHGELGLFAMGWERDLKLWVPSDSVERWVSWDFEKQWPHYKGWKAIAERRGITVMELLDKYEGSTEMLKRL